MRLLLNLAGSTLAVPHVLGDGQLRLQDASSFRTPTGQTPSPAHPLAVVVAPVALAYTNQLTLSDCTIFLCTDITGPVLTVVVAEGTLDRDYQAGDVAEARDVAGNLQEIQDRVLYTNPSPTPQAVGGIPAGSTFTDQSLQELFDSLLYPYQAPQFSSYAINYSVLEVGNNTGTIIFTWACTHTGNIVPASLVITQEFGVPIVSGLNFNSSPQSILDVDVLNTPGVLHWTISATDTRGTQFSSVVAVSWRARVYYGMTPVLAPDSTGVLALATSTLGTGYAGTYALAASPGSYATLAWPTSFGTPGTFKDANTGFAVAMRSPYVLALTNGFGITANYNVFQAFNQTSGSLNIIVS